MKSKKIIVIFLLITMLISQISFVCFKNFVYAESTNTKGYFYEQLEADAKKFYHAMEKMDEEGIFKTGNGDYDLVANGCVTQEQIKSYTEGNMDVLKSMGAARDAFYADHPEIFYVDFSYLSMRVTRDSKGVYHAYLGTGRTDSYYTEGFTNKEQVENAINEFNSKVDDIVKEANKKENVTEKVKFVHDEIINTTSYRMEGVCTKGNEGKIHTACGPILEGQAVCEGYAKALKVILDKLDIPCLTIHGVVILSEEKEEKELHMWNYVQIDGEWFAIDSTWDDPVAPDGSVAGSGIDGYENQKYCIVGDTIMYKHSPSGVMSAVEYKFTYPALCRTTVEELTRDPNDDGTVANVDGLVVKYNSRAFEVSYNGKGYNESAKDGKYIIGRMTAPDMSEDGKAKWVQWMYFDPRDLPIEDSANGFILKDAVVSTYVQFAVVDVAPPSWPYQNPNEGRYWGDTFIAKTEEIYNPDGNYLPAPFPKRVSPATTDGALQPGEKYHIVIEYDEDLELIEGTELGYILTCREGTNGNTNNTGVENSKLENLKLVGKRKIEFDFTTSAMWADSKVIYTFRPKNLRGTISKKAPVELNYGVYAKCVAYAYVSKGYDWNLYAQPTLMENNDLSMDGWVDSNGNKIDQSLKNRIALVTTELEPEEVNELNQKITGTGKKIKASKTFDLKLTVCKSQIVKTGDSIRIMAGFPEGYGPESEGVTFKAYHFGENNEPEEISCVVTKYGLLIECNSFSPFSIVAVEDDGKNVNTDKTVILSNTFGGKITGADDNIITLKEGESKTLTIQADEGYEIETVSVSGEAKEINNTDTMEITVNYEDVAFGSSIVDAKFVAKAVAEKEEQRGETAVEPIPDVTVEVTDEFEATLTSSKEKLNPGDEFEVTFNLTKLNKVEKGLIAVGGQLEYDDTVLEEVSVNGINGWSFESGYNKKNHKFVTDNSQLITKDGGVFKVTFKVKENVEVPKTTIFKVKNIAGSNGKVEISTNDVQLELNIEDVIFTSEKYNIAEGLIKNISAGTTVKAFKENVVTNQKIVFEDKSGKILEDDDVIATGMKVKVGEKLEYTLIVTGDIDENGKVTIQDLAQLKLHYIEEELLTGNRLMAADLDGNGKVSLNDIAQLKLILIGPME